MGLKERIGETVAAAIAGNRIVGAVTIVAQGGEIVYREADGWFDREAGIRMFPEAIFRLASVTKPLVSATALAMIERGIIELDGAVSDYIDWFRPKTSDGREPRITIRHLLSHTSGLGEGYSAADPRIAGGLSQTDLGLRENFSLVAQQPLKFEPGTAWMYGASTDVLGAVIEQLHGNSLEHALQQYILTPLEMTDTGFHVTDTSRLAVPYADGPPGLRRMAEVEKVVSGDGGTITFMPERIFNPDAFQSAGAGGVGTGDDLIKFFEAIRNHGGPVLGPEIVAQAIQNQIGDLPQEARRAGQRFGLLGAIVVDPMTAQRPVASGTIRWGGVYGHDWFVDFASGISAVMLTNTAVEGCTGKYPIEVARAIYGV